MAQATARAIFGAKKVEGTSKSLDFVQRALLNHSKGPIM